MKNSTNETKELQIIVKELLNEIGWNTKQLAEEICKDKALSGKSDSDIDEKAEYEKIRKQLSRPSTKPYILNNLIQFISTHRAGEKLKIMRLPTINPEYFSKNEMEILQGIAEISKSIFEQEENNN